MSITITAELVKKLRERTNAAMMDCKKALVEAEGDIEKAIELMRKTGIAKAVKKGDRIAAEGTILVLPSSDAKFAVLVEVNCETDFVARQEKFQNFAKEVGAKALQSKISTLEVLQQTFDESRLHLISEIGENITLRRYAFCEAPAGGIIGTYAHGDAAGHRIGTCVVLKKGSLELAKDLAMHVAALNPEYVSSDQVPANRLEKEKEIFIEQTRQEGKPEAMFEKIVAGKLKKFSTDITLLGQSFVKDPSKTVEALLKESGAEVHSFIRFEVGEGIEKKEDNFVQEVMQQVKGE